VKLKLPPAGIRPESKALVSLVLVCAIASVLVHVTVVPAATVIGFGMKAPAPLFSAPDGIVTVFDEGAGVGLGDGLIGVGEDGDEEPHPLASASNPTARVKRNVFITFSRSLPVAFLRRPQSNVVARATHVFQAENEPNRSGWVTRFEKAYAIGRQASHSLETFT
jgi:hypothetical protein